MEEICGEGRFSFFRIGDARVCLFADGDSGVRKKLMMQEMKRLLHRGREGSDPGHNGGAVLSLEERSSIQGWKGR